jgi:hypothetical protein
MYIQNPLVPTNYNNLYHLAPIPVYMKVFGDDELHDKVYTFGFENLTEQQKLMGIGGYDASNSLAALQNSPGYKFRLQQGLGGIENSASARGGLFSGANMKALNDYGSDYASNEYGNRLSQLGNLSGTGQATGAGMAAQGANYANQQGNLWTNNANSQGAAGIAGANARQSGLQNILGLGAMAYGAR